MKQGGKLIFNVKGMHCEGCENRIQKVVENLSGVMKAKADHRNGKVEVSVTSAASEHEIKDKTAIYTPPSAGVLSTAIRLFYL